MTHASPIGESVISSGALGQLPDVAKRLSLGKRVLAVTDEVVLNIAGEKAMSLWERNGLRVSRRVFKNPVIPDERALGEVLVAADNTVDFLVSLGGGSVTDITRYVATRLNKPYIPMPTAISMDGFFTNIALLIIGGMKTTIDTDSPAAVIADMDVISHAPARMNAAGFGEMASKFTSMADWYAASLINGELYCDEVERLMMEAVDQSMGSSKGLAAGDPEALLNLTDALYKSGVAMYWCGSARPAAGGEHHLTHFWVMRHNERGVAPNMHGHEVGVGAVLILDLWERMLAIDEKTFDVEAALKKMPSREEWTQTVKTAYRAAAPEAFKAQKNKSFDRGVRRREILRILDALPKLRSKFGGFLPGHQQLARMLKEAGAPYLPSQLHVRRDELIDSIRYAKEVRSKYTSLWVADALGILDDVSVAIADDAEALKKTLS